MNFKPNKWQITSVVILLLLILFNPGLKDFKEHTGDSDVTKKMNFLVASLYQDGNEEYLGIALNFIKITSSESNVVTAQQPEFDSSATVPNKADSLIADTAAFRKFIDSNSTKAKRSKTKKDPFILDSTDNKFIKH